MDYTKHIAKLVVPNYSSRNLRIVGYNKEMQKIEAVVNKLIDNADFIYNNSIFENIVVSTTVPSEDYDRKYWFKEVNLLDEVI